MAASTAASIAAGPAYRSPPCTPRWAMAVTGVAAASRSSCARSAAKAPAGPSMSRSSMVPPASSSRLSGAKRRNLRDELPALRTSRATIVSGRAIQKAGDLRRHQGRALEAQVILVEVEGSALQGQGAAVGDQAVAEQGVGPHPHQARVVG